MEKRFGMHFLKRTWVLFWRGRSWNVCVQKFLTFSDPLRAWYDWLICCSFFEMAKPSHNMPCNLPKFSLPNGTFSICPIFISAMIYASNQRLLCNSATMNWKFFWSSILIFVDLSVQTTSHTVSVRSDFTITQFLIEGFLGPFLYLNYIMHNTNFKLHVTQVCGGVFVLFIIVFNPLCLPKLQNCAKLMHNNLAFKKRSRVWI